MHYFDNIVLHTPGLNRGFVCNIVGPTTTISEAYTPTSRGNRTQLAAIQASEPDSDYDVANYAKRFCESMCKQDSFRRYAKRAKQDPLSYQPGMSATSHLRYSRESYRGCHPFCTANSHTPMDLRSSCSRQVDQPKPLCTSRQCTDPNPKTGASRSTGCSVPS